MGKAVREAQQERQAKRRLTSELAREDDELPVHLREGGESSVASHVPCLPPSARRTLPGFMWW